MKVNIIKKQTIEDYAATIRHKSSFEEWTSKVKFADWNSPGDILATFSKADLLGKGSNRVVFNIAGNNYRMICKYFFAKNTRKQRVHLYVCWIGTHKEYDKICASSSQYTINSY